jgi:hypothetical protein
MNSAMSMLMLVSPSCPGAVLTGSVTSKDVAGPDSGASDPDSRLGGLAGARRTGR